MQPYTAVIRKVLFWKPASLLYPSKEWIMFNPDDENDPSP